jgi:hypothetical protein
LKGREEGIALQDKLSFVLHGIVLKKGSEEPATWKIATQLPSVEVAWILALSTITLGSSAKHLVN